MTGQVLKLRLNLGEIQFIVQARSVPRRKVKPFTIFTECSILDVGQGSTNFYSTSVKLETDFTFLWIAPKFWKL